MKTNDLLVAEDLWKEPEQTTCKFDDLRRGITEDFQILSKFKWTLAKKHQKHIDFELIAFLIFFDL